MSYLTTNATKLAELIRENPDLPICVEVDSEVIADPDVTWWVAPWVKFEIGEVFDADSPFGDNDYRTYTSRERFRKDAYEYYCQVDSNIDFEDYVSLFDGDWKKCIIIRASA